MVEDLELMEKELAYHRQLTGTVLIRLDVSSDDIVGLQQYQVIETVFEFPAVRPIEPKTTKVKLKPRSLEANLSNYADAADHLPVAKSLNTCLIFLADIGHAEVPT